MAKRKSASPKVTAKFDSKGASVSIRGLNLHVESDNPAEVREAVNAALGAILGPLCDLVAPKNEKGLK